MLYRVIHEPPRLSKDLPADLHSIVSRCLAKTPEERPTPSELLAEFGDRDLTDDLSAKTVPPYPRRLPGIQIGDAMLADPGFQPRAAGTAADQGTASITDTVLAAVKLVQASEAPRWAKNSRKATREEVPGIALAITFALAVVAIAVISWFINEWFAIAVYSLMAITVVYGLLRAWLNG
jgi:serine/threonine protein kinase